MTLKYLFTVKYKDGSTYQQTQADRSVTEPDKRSAFYDVRHEDVKTFTLTDEWGDSYSVHLDDPHFEKDGVPLEQEPVEKGLTNFRVIYWRMMQVDVFEDGRDAVPVCIGYQLGWQANDQNGRNVQRTLDII